MTKRKQAKRNNGIRYSDEQKLIAVETVRALGGLVTPESVAAVQDVLGAATLSSSTIASWVKNAHFDGETEPSDSGSRKDKSVLPEFDPRAAAMEQWRQTRINYLKRANEPSAILWTDGKDAVAAAERAQKMEQLLAGLPTEIISVLPDVVKALEAIDLDPGDIFNELLNKAKAEAEARHANG